MVIDGYFIKCLVKELNQSLKNARLEKIGQVDQGSFLFQYYYQGMKHKLILNLYAHDYRLYLSKNDFATSEQTQFLTTLKKHLEGGILSQITQYQNDRVVIFEFQVSDYIFGVQSYYLIFEAMGKHANLMLVKDEMIIDTYKKMFFEEGRQLLPQAHFEFFPSNKKSFDFIDYESIQTPKDLTSTYMGLSQRVAMYLFEHHMQLSDLIYKPTYDVNQNLFYVSDIFPEDHQKQYFDSLSVLMDQYQNKKSFSKQTYEQFIDKQLKKHIQKKVNLEEQYQKAVMQMNAKDIGDLIYMSNQDLNSKTHELIVDGRSVILDEKLTLNENAQKQYKKYQKAKRSLDPIKRQISDNDELITLFNEFRTYLTLSQELDLIDFEQDLIPYGYASKKQTIINKKHKKKPHILKIDYKDTTYYIGKNSLQNAYVTHELSQPNDYWFHVKEGSGSHVLVKSDTLDETIIRTASMLAAFHSNMRLSSSIPVDYTQIRNIKKIPHKPGYQVIYKQFKTMFIDIDETLINTILHSFK